MKKILLTLAGIASVFFLGSCGINHAIIMNHNENSTQVNLSSNNFKVVDKVSGSAEVTYVFFIGGINKKRLYENAYSAMMSKANLIGSRAIVNLMTEEHIGGVAPFYFKRTITVSANVIEFTK